MKTYIKFVLILLVILNTSYIKADKLCDNSCKGSIQCKQKCEDDCWYTAEVKMFNCLQTKGLKYCMFEMCQKVKVCDKTTNLRFIPFQEYCNK
jgi:hypothetical protein